MTDDVLTAYDSRVELRVYPGDGSVYEADFGDNLAQVDLVREFATDITRMDQGLEPVTEPQRAIVKGIVQLTRHAPGYMTPEQRRIHELERENDRLRRELRR